MPWLLDSACWSQDWTRILRSLALGASPDGARGPIHVRPSGLWRGDKNGDDSHRHLFSVSSLTGHIRLHETGRVIVPTLQMRPKSLGQRRQSQGGARATRLAWERLPPPLAPPECDPPLEAGQRKQGLGLPWSPAPPRALPRAWHT